MSESEGRNMDNTTEQTARLLGEAFARILLHQLGESEKAEMRARNAQQTDPGICHSHDYCDANMAMYQAFEEVMGRDLLPSHDIGTVGMSDEDAALVNAAWDYAKVRHLTAPQSIPELLQLVEDRWPGSFWHLARGRVRSDEPLYGFRVLFGTEHVLAEGEAETAEAAILIALAWKSPTAA